MVKLVKIFDMIFILYGYMDRFIYWCMCYMKWLLNIELCVYFFIFLFWKKKYEWDEEYEKDI